MTELREIAETPQDRGKWVAIWNNTVRLMAIQDEQSESVIGYAATEKSAEAIVKEHNALLRAKTAQEPKDWDLLSKEEPAEAALQEKQEGRDA